MRALGNARPPCPGDPTHADERFSEEPIPATIARAVHDLLRSSRDISVLHFEAIDFLDPAMNAFARAMQANGSKFHQTRSANTWQVRLPDGWEAFVEGLSHKSRKLLRNRARALEKVEVRWVGSRADLDEFMPLLVELHQKRRQALGECGSFADPRFERFLAQAAAQLLERQQLQAFSLWLDGRPVATDIGFRSRNRWLCYQAGIEPEMMKHEPGKLANVHILRSAERFGITVVDFLRGDEPYKQKLKADPHPVGDMHFTKPGLAGYLLLWTWEIGVVARRTARALRAWWRSRRQPADASPPEAPAAGS